MFINVINAGRHTAALIFAIDIFFVGFAKNMIVKMPNINANAQRSLKNNTKLNKSKWTRPLNETNKRSYIKINIKGV